MEVGKSYTFLALALLSFFALQSSPVEACSCMPSHPQTHFCSADYVVILRVLRKSNRLVAHKVAYKVEVKKSYKMNADAHKMLKHGRIVTSSSSAGCGVDLEIGKLYLIAGRAPQLNSCQYIKEYQKMTVIERRGFAGVYRKGCSCNIKPCFGSQCLETMLTPTACRWSPFSKCETDYSGCMPFRHVKTEEPYNRCLWRRTPAYLACMANP